MPGSHRFEALVRLARHSPEDVDAALQPLVRPERLGLPNGRRRGARPGCRPVSPPRPPDPAPLARQTLAYGLSGLIVPLVGIITLPIFARVFSQGQYGLIELGTTMMTVAVAITDIGLTAAALRSLLRLHGRAGVRTGAR